MYKTLKRSLLIQDHNINIMECLTGNNKILQKEGYQHLAISRVVFKMSVVPLMGANRKEVLSKSDVGRQPPPGHILTSEDDTYRPIDDGFGEVMRTRDVFKPITEGNLVSSRHNVT